MVPHQAQDSQESEHNQNDDAARIGAEVVHLEVSAPTTRDEVDALDAARIHARQLIELHEPAPRFKPMPDPQVPPNPSLIVREHRQPGVSHNFPKDIPPDDILGPLNR